MRRLSQKISLENYLLKVVVVPYELPFPAYLVVVGRVIV